MNACAELRKVSVVCQKLTQLCAVVMCMMSIGCGAREEEPLADPASEPRSAHLRQPLPTPKIKLYIIDGTNARKADNFTMAQLYDRYTGPKYYADGPAWDCADCYTIMMAMANDMCNSLRAGSATRIALAGSSRGAFLVRAALVTAQRDVCPALNPESVLSWGGMVDPVPWAMRESEIVNSWGGWKAGVPGINIMKEVSTPGAWTLIERSLCKVESFAAPYLPSVVVNACHGELNGGNPTAPRMNDFLLERLITSAEAVPGMVFASHPPHVDAPFAWWEQWRTTWWIFGYWETVSGIARVSYRP